MGVETEEDFVWVETRSKNWYDALHKALTELGFTWTEADHGVFYKKIGQDLVALVVHVNDCMVTGSSTPLVNKFKVEMNKKYRLTCQGTPFSPNP